MADVLNPETESTTLNTELEMPTLEPATEQEQPLHESTSNPETAEVNPPALDADATNEPVAATDPVAAGEQATAPEQGSAVEPEAEQPAAPQPVATTAAEAPAYAASHAHEGEHTESMEDFSAALEAFEREQAAEAAAVDR